MTFLNPLLSPQRFSPSKWEAAEGRASALLELSKLALRISAVALAFFSLTSPLFFALRLALLASAWAVLECSEILSFFQEILETPQKHSPNPRLIANGIDRRQPPLHRFALHQIQQLTGICSRP